LSLPLVTRFGADPLLDLEVANKRYVDSSGGGATPRIVFSYTEITRSNNDIRFHAIYSMTSAATSEAARQIELDFDFTITRVRAEIPANTKNAVTVLSFRDDAAIKGSVDVAASTTGQFDSGAITETVADGSLVNFASDLSASSSGSLNMMPMIAEAQPT